MQISSAAQFGHLEVAATEQALSYLSLKDCTHDLVYK